jgi:hypothetical protein
MTDILVKKSSNKFHCILCDYYTSRKSQYDRHLLTSKHKNTDKLLTNTDIKSSESSEITLITNNFSCNCGKEYKHRQSLFNHKKKCMTESIIEEKNTSESVDIFDKNLILTLIQQNNALQKQMFEVIKNGTNNNNNNNNTTNSHNKSFNLNFFLNETCKDAMNIMDFVDSIKLQLSDLEKVGKIGFIEGISNIIVKNLNSLDETKRPVHCTDSKREVMYVKDEDKWEKENETKVKLRKAIKHVAHKNSKMLNEFRVKNPDCLKSNSKVSDQYNKLVFEALGGKGDNDLEKEDKIIKNIAKEVTIDSKA